MRKELEIDFGIRYNKRVLEDSEVRTDGENHTKGTRMSGGISVRIRVLKILALLTLLLLSIPAAAEGMISTTVVMRVSHMTQNAVVDVGEDLSMEVNIDGVTPVSYQWYFNDAPIAGATQKVYSIINAQAEDTGMYRMEAFDADGRMVVSMDISARVVDQTVPKAGDGSLPVGAAMAAMGAAACVLMLTNRRRAVA